uniref:NADH:ubiquinone reductase (H(+)-translocating) n=1 Tax=Clinostomum complanatum TaxID=235145 RepID=A0A649X6I9_CLICO|nr:NADH dehydrogenase subunit 5 [Clinostomum complanatum]
MLVLFLWFLLLCLVVISMLPDLAVIGEFVGFSFPGVSMGFAFEFDYVSVGCLLMLGICSFIAFFYCFHYFGGVNTLSVGLFPLIIWFVGVMSIMIVSSCLIFSLVMWEYLGFVSFLLILFYSNSYSLRAALVTLFSSRFGDVALFILFGVLLNGLSEEYGLVISCSLLLVVLTKSASYPFISWLLEAMRAPTPVSSLVHSSTLVAAGVWFVMRYSNLFFDSNILLILFLATIISIFITGVCSLYFVDLKKIVALSTCNNVAWCVIFFVWGDVDLVLLQLVTHGVSKCLLFMLVGDLMCSSGGSQSSLGVYPSIYSGLWGCLLLSVLVFSLCGLPFLGIFFSKHYFFSFVVGGVYNLLVCVLLFFGFFLSYAYSSRLMMLLSSCVRGLSNGYVSSFLMIGWSVLIGSLINILWVEGLCESVSLGVGISLMFVIVQVVGSIAGVMCFLMLGSSNVWSSQLWGCDNLVLLVYDSFNCLVSVCILGMYRWEIFVLRWLGYVGGSYSGLGVFSVQFLVVGLLLWGVYAVLFLSP